MNDRQRITTHVYVFGIAAAAVALSRFVLEHHPFQSEWVVPLFAFVAFLIAVELFEVRTSTGATWLPTATVDLSVWILFSPTAAIAMEIAVGLVGEGLIKRKPPIRVLFNLASTVMAAGLAGLTYHALPLGDRLSSPLFLLPAAASLLVFSLVNMGLTSTVIALSQGEGLRHVLSNMFGWHFLSGLFAAPLSAFLIFSYEFAGLWSLLLFGIPMYVVYQAHRLFEEMRESHKSTVAALTTALEADEPYTHGHSYRVAQYAVSIARRMGVSGKELETLEFAGLLHDIGKIAITNDIVCKPARLTKDEFDILASHPAIGSEIVEQILFLRDAADLVRHHHERPDGQGYPDGLKGDEISLGSHILNLCDAIDAMCSNRPYRAALTVDQCLEEVVRFRGTQFDAEVADVFKAMVEDGSFRIISQSDGAAQEIQRILRKAAARSSRRPVAAVA